MSILCAGFAQNKSRIVSGGFEYAKTFRPDQLLGEDR